MRLSFVEAMQGTVRDQLGETSSIAFDVSAVGEGDGHFMLRGLARAPAWVRESAAHGTLTIAPRERTITYVVHFASESGQALRLDARKRFSFLAPRRSMTLMPVTLSDASGEVLARGEMSFNLRDLIPFIASWLPVARIQQKRLEVRRRAVTRALLRAT